MHRNVALHYVRLWVILSLADSHLTEDQKSTIVNMHNELRSKVQPSAAFMQRVVWDEELHLVAETYASKCIWKHNPELITLSLGENLFVTTGPFNATKAMLDWFGEHVDYGYENDTCPENKMCGHYTQMVWANTNKVGCATYLCDTLEGLPFENSTVLVCNYSPQGNVEGQRPYESGEPCSECPDNLPSCEENICVVENLFSSVEPLSEDSTIEHSTVSPEGPLAKKEHTTLPEELTEGHRRMNDAGHLTEDQKSTIVNMHNKFRSKVQPSATFMQRVVWDEELHLVAETYASKCIWKHNPELITLSLGENLFVTTGPFNATKAMLDWFGEHVDYGYENDTCPENKMCGHYTQMVWANTNKVGCATYLCDTLEGLPFENSTVLVCNYSPQGNVEGQRPYESGEPCSECPDNLPSCEENICVSENLFSSVEPLPEDSTISPEEPTTLPEELTEGHRRMNDTGLERSRSEIQSASAPLLLVVWLLAALIL
ncbi:uncharacterized protein LOC127619117 isoform X2 [Xyrauchen texanus]|uniref:uncharacterized protein LOC127619117 isoform X2 n=1 Tax=Xyrauchen texanus TaxID=154827 RepID=UPI002241B27C|nr:uncharacterized protein LOC127619117 isoform X2 [Xyrauchen texanus]